VWLCRWIQFLGSFFSSCAEYLHVKAANFSKILVFISTGIISHDFISEGHCIKIVRYCPLHQLPHQSPYFTVWFTSRHITLHTSLSASPAATVTSILHFPLHQPPQYPPYFTVHFTSRHSTIHTSLSASPAATVTSILHFHFTSRHCTFHTSVHFTSRHCTLHTSLMLPPTKLFFTLSGIKQAAPHYVMRPADSMSTS
jgi:hypothetical protein